MQYTQKGKPKLIKQYMLQNMPIMTADVLYIKMWTIMKRLTVKIKH